jgi:hypothetical protein
MRYQSDLTTVEAIHAQLVKANPDVPASPQQAQYNDFYNYLMDIIPEVSDYITAYCGFSFVPYKDDKLMYFGDIARGGLYDSRQRLLWLPDELLNGTAVTWNDTLLSATDYHLYPTDEYAGWGLIFSPTASLPYSSDFNTGIEISGTWGWHLNGTQMYTTIENITVTSSATSIEVADANAYETLQYVRCENELMQIVDRDVNTAPTADTITVLRGVNGHTAAAHTTAALQTYMPVRGIRHAATRMCAYLYQKRTDVGGSVQIGDAAFLLDALPITVKEMMNMRRKLTFGTV